MRCNHYCNEPFRCWTCAQQFYAWAQARTNQPARRGLNFYAHVNVVAPIVTLVQVEPDPR